MPADQIFVLVLVVGIILLLGWLAMGSRRRAEIERERQEQAAAAAAEAAVLEASEAARPDRRRGRRR